MDTRLLTLITYTHYLHSVVDGRRHDELQIRIRLDTFVGRSDGNDCMDCIANATLGNPVGEPANSALMEQQKRESFDLVGSLFPR